MDLDWIARAVGARAARPARRIQRLWGGYGDLVRVELDGGPARTAIVKWAKPPRGLARDVGTRRKLRSFEVEAAFYRDVAPRCDLTCRVPALLAAHAAEDEWTLVLEDLDAAGFDGRADEANDRELDAVLAWLASFHARFLGERFASVWPIGTYWHLETRRDELANIADATLRASAPELAARLAGATHQTLLHGDAKDANFCFAATGEVAAVDFQYAGHGAGIVDVAYLLYNRRDEPPTGIDGARLDRYFVHLRREVGERADADAIETEWRALYPIARRDFQRFLAGWRPGR